MKLSVANPAAGTQKVLDVEYNIASKFYDKKIGDVVDGDVISPEWAGYLLKITGGSDKQGFPMKPGVLTPARVRLLLKKGSIGFRCTRDGLRRRKSVRGCVVSSEVQVLALMLVQNGPSEIEGLTDRVVPIPRGPKRASKIRKLFNLSPEDDVTKYVITHEKKTKSGETKVVAPKVQRLVTEKRIKRWETRVNERIARQTKSREKKNAYFAMLAARGIKK